MTTPAINRDEITTRPTFQHVRNISTGIVTDVALGPTNTRWDREHRPASVSIPLVNGFRPEGNWSHDWGQYYVANAGEGVLKPNVFGSQIFYNHGDHWSGGNNMDFPSPGIIGSSLINAAKVDALNKLKGQELNLGTFLAEGRQTIKMFGNVTSFIAKQVNNFRRKSPGEWLLVKQWQRGNLSRDLWHCIPQSWLELQYGWKPFMSDVFGGISHLQHRSRFTLPTVSCHSHKSGRVDMIETRGGRDGSSVKLKFANQQDVWVHLVYQMNNPGLAEISSLGLINPVEIVWELVPYSFVVDWFLPIGPWLSSLTADVGLSFKTGGQSTKSVVRFAGAEVLAPPTAVQWDPPHLGGTRGSFNRLSFAGTPFPGLYVKSPLSGLHVANGLALLAQAFR